MRPYKQVMGFNLTFDVRTHVMSETKIEKLAVEAKVAAEMLSLSRRRLRDYTVPNGPIRAIRLKRKLLYPVRELERFLAGGESNAT